MSTLDQIQSVLDSDKDYEAQYFIYQIGCTLPEPTRLQAFWDEELSFQICNEEQALMQLNECDYDVAKTDYEDENWLVLTDEDADEHARSYAEDWMENDIYDMADHLVAFFDKEGYVQNILDNSDRGDLLAPGDQIEHEETVEGITYFLYKQ